MRSILRFTLLLIILSSASACKHLNLPSKSIDRIVLYSNQGLDSTLVEASDIDAIGYSILYVVLVMEILMEMVIEVYTLEHMGLLVLEKWL